MAPCRRTTKLNSAELLVRRSRGVADAGTLLRLNLKVLRSILLQENRKFMKVWSKTSKSAITYENGKLYFENYLNCYSCVHSEPHTLYKLPKRTKVEKFEDALLCQSPLDKTLALPCDHKSSLVALTANNWLYRLSAETGEVLQRIYLSSNHKFRWYLGWEVSQEILYVKSVQNQETPLARQAGITQDIVMHLAIFHVFPLQVVGTVEISRKVFGKGVTDVVLSQGVLAVSYSNKSVKLYSFEHILDRYMTERLVLGQQSSLLGGKTVGEAPFGIPVNIKITDCPPVLFEVSCSSNGVQIGGYPWHYIYTPPHRDHKGTHHICSLKDKTMPASQVTVTSSGRSVKRRFHQLDDDPDQETFRTVEYEDELDLLAVVVTNGDEGEGKAHIRLHDNQSGQLHRTIDLVEPWDETYRHELFFDKDTIVHIEQKNVNFCCHVYKLKATRK
uniref:DDB1 and CUL4 associated factor 17 n=1 Tax=Echeneis naucrates TaxID=173247 RepID=A0A665W300_ECHNA